MIHDLGGDLWRCRVLAKRIHKLAIRVHQVEENAEWVQKGENELPFTSIERIAEVWKTHL